MKVGFTHGTLAAFSLAIVAAVAHSACLDSPPESAAQATSSGTGGARTSGTTTTGKGATVASAGSGGNGATTSEVATGSAGTGTGGSAATGSTGNGSTASSSAASASATASAGSGGESCVLGTETDDPNVPVFTKSWTFDSDLQAWSGPDVTATFDSQDGSPTLGAAKVVVPFTATAQLYSLNLNGSWNLAGQVVSARFRLKSCNKTGSVTALIAIKSTSGYVYARSAYLTLDASKGWVTLTYDPSKPDFTSGVQDLTDVLEIDMGFYSAGAGPFTSATVEVDTIGFTTISTGAGGSSATSSASTTATASSASASSSSASTGAGGAGGS